MQKNVISMQTNNYALKIQGTMQLLLYQGELQGIYKHIDER